VRDAGDGERDDQKQDSDSNTDGDQTEEPKEDPEGDAGDARKDEAERDPEGNADGDDNGEPGEDSRGDLEDEPQEDPEIGAVGEREAEPPRTPNPRPAMNCSGPGTELDSKGLCVCPRGYSGDDPVTSRGCWTCDPCCDADARCGFPGKCECSDGLVGDGVASCRIPKPLMKSMSPQEGPVHTPVTIRYGLATGYRPQAGYCRFGVSVAPASLVGGRALTCEVPVGVFGAQRVQISFDSVAWSDDGHVFQVRQADQGPWELPRPIFGFVGLAVVLLVAVGARRRRARSEAASEGEGLLAQRPPSQGVERIARGSGEHPRKRGVGTA